MQDIIRIENVEKSFADHQVLKKLSLNVPEQSVFAFLGNNGAGKSTTIRILAGLLGFNGGRVEMFGKTINRFDPSYKKHLGCLIDSPVLYDDLTPNEFLSIGQRIKGLPKSSIEHALLHVDMKHAANKKIAAFSLGMKQRIALANALLGEPKVLLLDEPTNGLDPQGMKEVRSLIKNLPAAIGCTVFLSSHLLDEVEKVSSHVAIIEAGATKVQGKLTELLDQSGCLLIDCDNPAKAIALLLKGGYKAFQQDNNLVVVSDLDRDNCIAAHHWLFSNHIGVFSSHFTKASLETYFGEQQLVG